MTQLCTTKGCNNKFFYSFFQTQYIPKCSHPKALNDEKLVNRGEEQEETKTTIITIITTITITITGERNQRRPYVDKNNWSLQTLKSRLVEG